MASDTILVVDFDTNRRSEVKSLLDFLGLGPVDAVDYGGWQGTKFQIVKTIFLGRSADARWSAEIAELRATAPAIPIILIGSVGPTQDGESCVQGELEFPASYEQFCIELYRADVWRRAMENGAGLKVPELARALVGNTPAIHQVRRLIEQVAETDANVLILGESGTGKEVVARSLHMLSRRHERGFVPVNCGAIPGDLLESELFGHEKGAFTGAINTRQGRFELAEGGTLFLDEIGDMPLPMQVKLLRVIQERSFERVGSNRSISADVRLIAATHRNLEDNIKDGAFREDLYYRLNVFPIELPPLRERRDDIPLLINEFIVRLEKTGRGSVRLTPGALGSLCAYSWPGNVRELANLMERLIIMFPNGLVDVRELPLKFQVAGAEPIEVVLPAVPSGLQRAELPASPNIGTVAMRLPVEGINLKDHLAELELSFITQALDEAEGIVAHAAERLGMRRTTLVEKMKKYGLQRGE